MSTEAQIAWAAGVFEGEGCFYIATRNRRADGVAVVYPSASVASTDLDVLQHFRDVVGMGTIIERHPKGHKAHWKQQWVWRISAIDDVRTLVSLFLPWLCERRRLSGRKVVV